MQCLVNDAGAAEDDDPGIGAGNRRDHQRQHDEADHLPLVARRQIDDGKGRGIANDRRNSGDHQTKSEGTQEDGAVQRIREKGRIGRQRPAVGVAKAFRQQDHHRRKKDDRRKDRCGQSERQGFGTVLKHPSSFQGIK
ncbi:hypothetical protein D9M72_493180 [compost metagenome]